ncbi:hypothetical protein [Lysobacter capsici]|nr:hypothetical protein [Lysobacter capsici]
MSIHRATARGAALFDALEVGETWEVHDAESAFNYEHHWTALDARAAGA